MPGNTVFEPLTLSDLALMSPEIVLLAVFVVLLLLDLFLPGRVSRTWIGGLTVAGLLAVIGMVLWQADARASGSLEPVVSLLNNSYRIDGFALLLKLLLLSGTVLVALLALGSARHDKAITDKGEYYYLLLPAAMGASIMVSSGNLITLYIGLELLSMTSYVLVGLRRRSTLAAEAAFKYVVTGGISSAFILFGMSYVYGVTGSVELGAIKEALGYAMENYPAFVYVGFGFMLVGFAVKIAAAPFHAWAPDVYQGASTPIAGFLAVISKGAALAVILRIMFSTVLFAMGRDQARVTEIRDELNFAVLLVAAAAMLVGVLAALRQMNAKRLLALSGVANAGYLLVPIGVSVTALHSNNVGEFIFYLTAYLFMTLGAFAVLTEVSRAAGHDELRGFAGMYYRAPWTAAATVIFVLSLAGLPISGGFFGKLFILLGAAHAGVYWIVAIIVLSSVISYYFYFGLVRQMFMRTGGESDTAAAAGEGRGADSGAVGEVAGAVGGMGDAGGTESAGSSEDAGSAEGAEGAEGAEDAEDGEGVERADGSIRISWPVGIVIWICAAATLVLGIAPGFFMEWIDSAFAFQIDFIE